MKYQQALDNLKGRLRQYTDVDGWGYINNNEFEAITKHIENLKEFARLFAESDITDIDDSSLHASTSLILKARELIKQ